MNRAVKSSQSGFTLVELTLSMAFIAMLLLGIAMLTMQISTIYNKGLTMRAVNEAGQLISRDIQNTLNGAIASDDGVIVRYDTGGGRLCANNTVYAWNYGKYLTSGGFNGNQNILTDGTTGIRLLKFTGDSTYCTPVSGAYKQLPVSSATTSWVHLLKEGDSSLALHKFTLGSTVVTGDTTGQRIYTVSFTLGTTNEEELNATSCPAPKSATDDSYCAVNVFNFTARAGNKQAEE